MDSGLRRNDEGTLNILFKYKFTGLYFAFIVAVNLAFGWFGEYLVWPTPFGPDATWSPLAVVVGFWFVLRDYAQVEIGNRILGVMFVAMLVTWILAGPNLAIASCTAFAFGEIADWAVFSRLKKPFAQRVLISSLIAVPIDTVLFLGLADALGVVPGVRMLSWPMTLTEVLSKLAAAYIVYLRVKNRATMVNGKLA